MIKALNFVLGVSFIILDQHCPNLGLSTVARYIGPIRYFLFLLLY